MKAYLRAGAILVALISTLGIAAAQQSPGTSREPATMGGKPELQLTTQQKSQVYKLIMSERSQPAPAGVSLRIGAKVPGTVQLNDVPESIHSEIPGVRQYKYIVVQNQVALIDPQTTEVIEIIRQ
ncbi:MAG TPA: DUF1236 domain-containing protein [Xanthobacteraceae bacterium]|jgi:hypothetical protein